MSPRNTLEVLRQDLLLQFGRENSARYAPGVLDTGVSADGNAL